MANHYLTIKQHVAELATQYGRKLDEITIVAVTKNHPLVEVMPAYKDGCRDFGENRIPEALVKKADAPADLRWHFIGTLQSNKVKKVIGNFSLVHSVHDAALAKQIAVESAKRGVVTDILLQVNTSGESTKHGCGIEEWKAQIGQLIGESAIRVSGLMTMAPLAVDEKMIRPCFAALREFREALKAEYGKDLPLEHLSMGMSQDYRWAIAEGATILRIGSAIFV